MNILEMKQYGTVLTGREFGKDTMKSLDIEYPVVLDFSGVFTLGSSYADEVLGPIAAKQKGVLHVQNAIAPVLNCIQNVVQEGGIELRVLP